MEAVLQDTFCSSLGPFLPLPSDRGSLCFFPSSPVSDSGLDYWAGVLDEFAPLSLQPYFGRLLAGCLGTGLLVERVFLLLRYGLE